jgi:hypothetical protein
MTRKTLCGHIGIIARIVAFIAIINGMALCKREKGMVKLGRPPTNLGGMALNAIGTKVCHKVTWIGGRIIIRLMTWEALSGYIGVVCSFVTLIAIKYGMTFCKGKECVIKSRSTPGKGGHRVTVCTFGWDVSQNMIGLVGRLEVLHVTIYTFYTQRLKMEQGCRLMAIHAICDQVRPLQWEPGLSVKICYILHNPRSWRVAPGAIHTHRLVMHVCMTTKTVGFCVGKDKARMTWFAIDGVVLTYQG